MRMFIAGIAAVLGIALGVPTVRAENALALGGTPLPSYIGWFVDTPRYPLNSQYFANYEFTTVPYPQTIGPFPGIGTPTMGQSVATGRTNLYAAIQATDGPLLVMGNSQGSLPTDAVRATLESDPDAPDPSQLTFLVNGDPEQRNGIFSRLFAPGTYIPILDYTVLGPFESSYDLVVFVNEYDGIADFPDRPWNLLADLNALFGVAYRHAATGSLNPYEVPADNVTVTVNSKGATTTTYLGPATNLPLTLPLRILGVHADVVDAIDGVLRPIIDAGYSRNDALPIHGPTVTGGQFHPPTIDLTAPQSRQTRGDDEPSPTVADDEGSEPSAEAEADHVTAARHESPAAPAVPAADGGDDEQAAGPTTDAEEDQKPVKKKRPRLDVVKGAEATAADEATDRSTAEDTTKPPKVGDDRPSDERDDKPDKPGTDSGTNGGDSDSDDSAAA
jgi:hypothetical protein